MIASEMVAKSSQKDFLRSFLFACIIFAIANIAAITGLYAVYGIYTPIPAGIPAYVVFGLAGLVGIVAFLRSEWMKRVREGVEIIDGLIVIAILIQISFWGQHDWNTFSQPLINRAMIESERLYNYAIDINSHNQTKRIGDFVADRAVAKAPLFILYYKSNGNGPLPKADVLRALFRNDACVIFSKSTAVKLAAINYTIENTQYVTSLAFRYDDCTEGNQEIAAAAPAQPAPLVQAPKTPEGIKADLAHKSAPSPVVSQANDAREDEMAELNDLSMRLNGLEQGVASLRQLTLQLKNLLEHQISQPLSVTPGKQGEDRRP